MMRHSLHITLFFLSLSGAVFADTLAIPQIPESEPATNEAPAEMSEPIPAPEGMESEPMALDAPMEEAPATQSESPVQQFNPPPPAPIASDGSYSITLPGRGMNMEQVEAKFGAPTQKFPEVGEPPIIRWNYPGFTVYFEYQYVINAVAHIQPAQ